MGKKKESEEVKDVKEAVAIAEEIKKELEKDNVAVVKEINIHIYIKK